MDTITITGNLTRDPELRFTTAGRAQANVSVAVNRRWQNRQTNEWEEATSFFDIVVWGDLAQNAAESLTKGMGVIVAGRMEQRSWETPEGDKRSKLELVADEISPSLRYATAKVIKTVREGNAAGGSQPAAESSTSSPAAARVPAGAAASAGGGEEF